MARWPTTCASRDRRPPRHLEAGLRVAGALEWSARSRTGSTRTALVAHRLSQAQASDRIAVLDGGRVVEQGTHAELLRGCGRYAALWAASGPA
jgi:ATP-binding cassette subfamily C protein